MKPLIGITAGFNNSKETHFLTDYYIEAVESLGGIPIILPAVKESLVDDVYQGIDGLIFSGGSDIDPEYFQQYPLRGNGEITPNRDAFEIALAKKALQGKKPVLAICRGTQVINIAAGGDIYQDIKSITEEEHVQIAPKWYPFHYVQIKESSLLYKIIGKNKIKVNTFHHQSINRLGKQVIKTAWTEDSLTEAIEIVDKEKTIIGVQWHPECGWDKYEHNRVLFQFLIEKAGVSD